MTARGTPSGRDRDGGFLLLEALTTLALSALVIAGLLALGGGLSRAVDRAAARLEGAEAGRRSVAAMAQEIAGLARRRFAGEGDRFVFQGEPDRIAFVLDVVQVNGLAAPVAVAYQATAERELLRAEGALPIGASAFADADLSRPRRLEIGGELVRFAYVERLEDGGEIVTDSWNKPSALPRAVRVDRVDPATGAVLASRRVALVSETEPGCAAPGVAFCSTAKKRKPGEGAQQPPAPEAGQAERGRAP
jgi:type II secretory pathway component PulJ